LRRHEKMLRWAAPGTDPPVTFVRLFPENFLSRTTGRPRPASLTQPGRLGSDSNPAAAQLPIPVRNASFRLPSGFPPGARCRRVACTSQPNTQGIARSLAFARLVEHHLINMPRVPLDVAAA